MLSRICYFMSLFLYSFSPTGIVFVKMEMMDVTYGKWM